MSDELVELYRKECHLRKLSFDLDDSLDWFSLTVGWAIARGLEPKEAWNFAIHIRYEAEMG